MLICSVGKKALFFASELIVGLQVQYRQLSCQRSKGSVAKSRYRKILESIGVSSSLYA